MQLQLTSVTGAAHSRLNYLIGLLSHRRSSMSNYNIAHCHAFIVQHSTVAGSSSDALLFYSLAKPDSQTKNMGLASQTIVIVFIDKLECA